jgi:hypothetical protein
LLPGLEKSNLAMALLGNDQYSGKILPRLCTFF